MERDQFIAALNQYLQPEMFDDYCPNGLQVEGRGAVEKVVAGVTASRDLIEAAIQKKADTILVHHGILWNGQNPVIKGFFRERIRLLLEHDLNLVAYHLPLDAHEEVGNNVQMAKLLRLSNLEGFGRYKSRFLGTMGYFDLPVPVEELVARVENLCDRKCMYFPFGPEKVKTVAIVSGGAQKYLEEASDKKIDCFITGEVSEYNFHMAREEGVHFISAGHHATERFGIIALAGWITANLGVETEFVDIPNPV